MLIVYRKVTGEVVANTGTNSYLPAGPPFDMVLEDDVLPRCGGAADDYAAISLHDTDQAPQVRDVMDAGSCRVNLSDPANPRLVVSPRVHIEGPAAATVGQEVGIRALLQSEGTVELLVDQVSAGSAPLVDGVALFTLEFATPGAYIVLARVDGHGGDTLTITIGG